MINTLGHHLNKSVFVSIPTIFDDESGHACVLVGIEVSGLWLEGEELANALQPEPKKRESPSVFVPFGQIRYLVPAFPRSRETPHLAQPHRVAPAPQTREGKPGVSDAKKRR